MKLAYPDNSHLNACTHPHINICMYVLLIWQQCKEGEDLNADQIKAALLDSTGCSGIM